ncbi:MAG: MFS transporter [Rhizobiaceae bacterium]|nr:MFS transporter [Rhizobiaceae bacterium]
MNRTLPIVLAVALFMEHMDSTVIATSLPAIAVDIGTNPVALKLALTSYLVSLAIFIPVSGWTADRFGARNVFRAAIAVFVVGSIMCAMSGSLGAFVVSRFIQGMGGAMMTPLARLVLVRATPRSDLVSAMAWLTVPALVGPMVGPPVGGFLTTYISWHWIFLINVPIGFAGILISGKVLPKINGEKAEPIDGRGFFLAAIAASGIVFGLSVISLPALPPAFGVGAVLVGVAAAIAYPFHARRKAHPLLNLGLFSNRAFSAAIYGGFFFRVGTGATPFLLPLMFQLLFGLSPFASGLLTFVTALGALAMKFVVAGTLRSAGFKVVTIGSAVIGGLLIGANALFTVETPYALIVTVLFAAGLMRSMFFTSTNALVFAELSDRDAAQATAIASVSQQISIALGVALAGGLLEITAVFSGAELDQTAFVVAFSAAALASILSALFFARLPADTGSSVSGHQRGQRRAEAEPGLQG